MNAPSPKKRPIRVLLAAPRGFCAGVDRAIHIVERAVEKYGAPVYVRHEIVHNKHVVERLKALGAVFVDELDQAPDDRPVVFSAHGVPKAVPEAAKRRAMLYLDATCPLVSKVHLDAERHFKAGQEVVLIGHAGHPEVIGTLGQLPEGAVVLIETAADAETFQPRDPARLAYVTQTTLSVDDTAEIVGILQRRFPNMDAPHREDICYATTNRQEAVKRMAAGVRSGAGGGLTELIELPAAGRGRAEGRRARRAADRRCGPDGLVLVRRRVDRGRHRNAPQLPRL